MQNFIAEIRLASPMILRHRLVGDSLLAGLRYGQHHDWERAIAELPIAYLGEVPQMSVLLPYYPASRTTETVTFGRSIMRDMMHNRQLATTLDRMPPQSHLKPATGPFSNIFNTYITSDIPKAYFVGRGDVAGVLNILRSLTFLGCNKAKGWGEIASVDVWPVESNNEWFGVIGRLHDRQVVLRPIPQRFIHVVPAADHVVNSETWHNPYWPGHAAAVVEPCLVPPFVRDESFTEAELARL